MSECWWDKRTCPNLATVFGHVAVTTIGPLSLLLGGACDRRGLAYIMSRGCGPNEGLHIRLEQERQCFLIVYL